MRPVYVQALVYADNIAVIAKNKEELQNAVTKGASDVRDRVMRINVYKSKVMVTAR